MKVVVSIDEVEDKTIHRITGFSSLVTMLAIIAILCNGEIKVITQTTTTLTWFEELFLYFETIS